jgi:hypothetical protein
MLKVKIILVFFDTTSLSDGTYEIMLSGQDKAGNQNHGIKRTITVDNEAPVVTWITPLDMEMHSSPVELKANCDGGTTESEYVNFWWVKTGDGQTFNDARENQPNQYNYVRRTDPGGGTVSGNDFSWQLLIGDDSVIDSGYDWTGEWTLRAACKDEAGNYAHSEIKILVDTNTPTTTEATTWHSSMVENFVTRLTDVPSGKVKMKFIENTNAQVDYYEYQFVSANLDGSGRSSNIVNMNNYPGGVSCNEGVCEWLPTFNDGKLNIHRFRAVFEGGVKSDWSNWNDLDLGEFSSVPSNQFTYRNFLDRTGIFSNPSYIPQNGGYSVREQIKPVSNITNDPIVDVVNNQTIEINYEAFDADTEIKNVSLFVSFNDGEYLNFETKEETTSSFVYTFNEDGKYCFHTVSQDVADDRALDNDTGNIEDGKGCQFEVSIDRTAPVITVDRIRTQETKPSLSGTVNDPTAVIELIVDGNTYIAINNGNGTWTLPANTLVRPLALGFHDVLAAAGDGAGNWGIDETTNEVEIFTDQPVAQTINYTAVLEMNYGDRYTDDRDVRLDLYPPKDFTATEVIFSQKSDFSDASWEKYYPNFRSTCKPYYPCGREHHERIFNLRGSRDERKAVYAKMRNAQGIETYVAVNHIILVREGDSRAENDDNDDDDDTATGVTVITTGTGTVYRGSTATRTASGVVDSSGSSNEATTAGEVNSNQDGDNMQEDQDFQEGDNEEEIGLGMTN